MMVHQNERLRSVLLILLLCTLNTVESDKLDSRRRRLPTRRTGLRQPLDEYGNPIPLRDSRDFPADQRSFLIDERSYPLDDNRIFQQREYEEYEGDDEQEPVTTVPDDLVLQYTSKLSSAIMVSVCSGICSSVLVSLLMKMVISKIYKIVVVAVSLLCAGSCFSKNKANADVTEFSKALGVFFLLILQRSRRITFISQFATQAKSAMLLSSRKQFPPSDNPWKHVYDPEDRDAIDFKMWNSLIGIILMGTIMGWSASTYVPLLPGWLGALGSASFLGYSGTLKDSRGDVLRYIGYSLDQYFSFLISVSNDVLLWEKTTVLSSRLFSIILRFEKKNKIVERLSFYFAKTISLLTSFFKSVRSDINADNNNYGDRDRDRERDRD